MKISVTSRQDSFNLDERIEKGGRARSTPLRGAPPPPKKENNDEDVICFLDNT
jgi:hypothetical protein